MWIKVYHVNSQVMQRKTPCLVQPSRRHSTRRTDLFLASVFFSTHLWKRYVAVCAATRDNVGWCGWASFLRGCSICLNPYLSVFYGIPSVSCESDVGPLDPFHAKKGLETCHGLSALVVWLRIMYHEHKRPPNQPGKNIANESAANNWHCCVEVGLQNSWCSLLQSPEQNAANNRGFCCYSTQNKGLVKIKAQEISDNAVNWVF